MKVWTVVLLAVALVGIIWLAGCEEQQAQGPGQRLTGQSQKVVWRPTGTGFYHPVYEAQGQ